MKSALKKIIVGDVPVTEYSTITMDDDIAETVYLEASQQSINISTNHYVLCLDPVTFGVWFKDKEQAIIVSKSTALKIYFCNDFYKIKKNIVAIVDVGFTEKIEETSGTLLLLKLKSAEIYHTGFLKTQFFFHRYYKKPGLTFSYYKSLIAAYSYPRRVSVVSFKEDDYYNIFPMDLLGDIKTANRFAFGLRHTNVTLQKIIETKKIVVSEFSYTYKDIIYQLGKHHGASPPPIRSLLFRTMLSKQLKFYIPEWIESYKEIRIIKTINLGSHMLLWGEVLNEEKLTASSGHLFHIHFLQYYNQKENGITHVLV